MVVKRIQNIFFVSVPGFGGKRAVDMYNADFIWI